MLKHCDEQSRIDHYIFKLDGVKSAAQDYNQALVIEAEEETYRSACVKCAKPQWGMRTFLWTGYAASPIRLRYCMGLSQPSFCFGRCSL